MVGQYDIAVVILRVAVGAVILAHGVKHAKGRVKTGNWFASIGFRHAPLQWLASTATEIGVGVLLIVGALTGLAAAGLIGVMTVAFWTVHRKVGFWVTARPDEGWEYVFVLTAVAFAIAIAGPGEVSVDASIGLAELLDGWVGLALGLGGVVAGFGQMAVFWRPVADASS